MKREILTLLFFGGAGAAAGENGGAAAAENGNDLSGKTAEAADGTGGSVRSASGTDGEKAGEAKKDAAGEKPAAETGGGKAVVPDGAPAADGEKTDAKETDAGEADRAALLRKAALAARIRAAERTARRWEREAEALKAIYPGFSLEQALCGDAGFTALLKAGAPVRLAYEAAHLEEILGAAMRYAAKDAGRRMAQSMAADARRARENPVLDRAASVTRKDVASMTEKEILKILRQVSNGEKVVF